MSVKIERIEEVTIQDFAKAQGLEIVIKERDPHTLRMMGPTFAFYAALSLVEMKDDPKHPILRGFHGDGRTPQEALDALCRIIEGQYLVVQAMLPEKRREFYAPKKLVAAPIEENVG